MSLGTPCRGAGSSEVQRVVAPAADEAWTDCLGPQAYVDYTVTVVVGTPPVRKFEEHMRFLAGLGIHGREGLGEGGEIPRFMHGDLIGSTMMETGPTGEVASSGGWEDSLLWQYTAFGEPIWPWPEVGIQRTVSSGRYKYAGSYGYEWGMIHLWGANEDLPPILLLHVGERWYQPGVGRFIQRDPIGIDGGLNVYVYARNAPTIAVDPNGEAVWVVALVLRAAGAIVTWVATKAPPSTQQSLWGMCVRVGQALSRLGTGYKQPPGPMVNPPPTVWIDPRYGGG